MSLRNLRKLHGVNSLPEAEESSNDEHEEYKKADKNYFAYLPLSSHSGTDGEESSNCNEPDSSDKKINTKDKKKKRKSRKDRRRACFSRAEGFKEMDEVEKSVMEVNALLGTPPPAEPKVEEEPKEKDFRQVEVSHLNVAVEMKRVFGSDDEDGLRRNRGRVPNLRRIRKQVIIPGKKAITSSGGLSMMMLEQSDGYACFTFTHSRKYREIHKKFLQNTDHRLEEPLVIHYFDDKYKHVEAQLEFADLLFNKEEYIAAFNLIEKIILKMQSVFHPLFHLSDMNTKLEYKYIENRPFHVAFLKYIYLLSNRACHRTALELAKMLMNVDPKDPLAVIFIIDVLAIRALEFEWLIKAIDFWKAERGADLMFNMKYSYALAHFHLANDGKGEMSRATELLREAILTFPRVALHLMELASVSDAKRLVDHKLFATPVNAMEGTKKLRELYLLFAHFATGRWREKDPARWLVKTVLDLVAEYDENKQIQEEARKKFEITVTVLRKVPTEVLRHLCVIKPLSNLIVDGAVPEVPNTRLTDPLPVMNETVDHPGYIPYSSNYRRFENTYIPNHLSIEEDNPPAFLSSSDFSTVEHDSTYSESS